MSSVVFNVQNTTQQQSQNSIEQLFPTTIGGATKMYQRYQHIMPAPEQHQQQQQSNIKSSNGLTIKTRKYTPRGMALATAATTGATATTATAATTMPYNVDQSQSVQRRNARERNRVKQVNNSFARLRQHIPQSIIADLTKGGGRGPHKKISKVDTLRIAVEYIRRLQDLVDDLNGGATTAATATTAGNHLNLCLDETSCSSGSSTHSSSNNSSHHIYSYNNHSNHSSSHSSSSSNHSNNLLQQQQQLQRQQFPNNPLTPITLNGNHLLQPFAATQQLQQQLLQQHQQQQQHQLQQLQQQQQQQQPQLATTTTTTGACHSPTSSFNSSMSFDSGTYEAAPQQLSPPAPASSSSSSSSSSNSSSSAALDAQLQLKFEPYEHFQLDEEDCTPDDEEILDYISLWQEQ